MANKGEVFVMINYEQNAGVSNYPPPMATEDAYVRNTCWHLFTGTIFVS